MLKQNVINKAIREYLDNNVTKSSNYNLTKIARDIMKVIEESIIIANAERKKLDLPKWSNHTKLSFADIAVIINKLYTIKRISFTKNSTSYDDDVVGIYIESGPRRGTYAIDDTYFEGIIYELASNEMTTKEFNECKNVLRVLAPHTEITRNKNFIAVNNGIYKRDEKKLIDFDPDFVFITKSPVDYNPNAINQTIINPDWTKWDVESWMKEIAQDDEIYELLWQILAAAIRPNHGWTKAIWLYSEVGNNGKGTFCQLVRNLAGNENCTSLQVSDFSKEFALGSLLNASVVVTDENDVGKYIDNVANYKAAVTGDSFTVNQKYKAPITASFSGLIIQCMNGFPKTKDKTGSFYRRLLMVPFNKSFTGIERPYIKHDYLRRKEVLEYVLYKTLHMDFDDFIEPSVCKAVMNEYAEYNDTTVQFWNEMRDVFVWDLLPNQFMYDLYISWQKQNAPHGKPVNKLTFLKDMKNIIEKDNEWEWRGNQNDKIKTGNKMDGTENLILEYNLVRWMNPTYTGNMPDKITAFKRNNIYRGIKRKTPKNKKDDS